MAIKIKFDPNHQAISPTFVLVTKSGRKLGSIPAHNIKFDARMKDFCEVFFDVTKPTNSLKIGIWNKIKNLKLAYCPEWDALFELSVDISEEDSCLKSVTGKSLGEAELSHILIYNTEINTEADIEREDYSPTVFYNLDDTKASLLHRILEKAPHYKIVHVDATIAKIQRQFSFNEVSIIDAFNEISEEIKCYFKIETTLNDIGKIERTISVYDLQSFCPICEERGEFEGVCPECGNSDFLHGYGEDTTIFVSSKKLADAINYTSENDTVKNCYKLSSGDDLMTATIVNCNPNGSGYIWNFSEEDKEDMSDQLSAKLSQYDDLYIYYSKNHIVDISGDLLNSYNALIKKYSAYSESLSALPDNIVGFPALIENYYNALDFQLYLENGLMPNVSMQETNAKIEASKLTAANIEYIAVANKEILSSATTSSAALSIARTIVDARYQVKTENGTIDPDAGFWFGKFIVTNYSDEDDAYTTDIVSLPITDDYEKFVKQKIEKSLSNNSESATDIVGLFKLDLNQFNIELQKYCLNRLVSFNDACQACLNIMIEQGVADSQVWIDNESDLYEKLYHPYFDKLTAIQKEIQVRENEIAIIRGKFDSDNNLISEGVQTLIDTELKRIQVALNFESFIGDDLWIELVAYRREDTYRNDNYISDGLNNADLIKNAIEFLATATKEIKKVSTLQPTITASLKNLLVLKEFAPLVKHFELGNWIRLQIDNLIYRLRLTSYSIDFSDLGNIEVEFSDIATLSNVETTQKLLSKSASMAASYSSVSHKADLGKKSNDTLKDVATNGITTTKTKISNSAANDNMSWDMNGLMLKKFDDISNEYDSCQMKIFNSTISLTDDNWKNVKSAVGGYYYVDPKTKELKYAYGINAEVLIGKLILGESLGIYNSSGSLSFDESGFIITNGKNTFVVDPNAEILLKISNSEKDIFYIDDNGRLYISCDGTDVDIGSNSTVAYLDGKINSNADGLLKLSETVSSNSNSISDEVSRAKSVENSLDNKISQNKSAIETETSRAKSSENILTEKVADLEKRIEELEEKLNEATA